MLLRVECMFSFFEMISSLIKDSTNMGLTSKSGNSDRENAVPYQRHCEVLRSGY
jgi:hypothetical protein